MRLILFRHGVAEEPHDAYLRGVGDAGRRLLEAGAAEVQRVGIGLQSVLGPIDRLFVSPLLRAQETAHALGCVIKLPEPIVTPQLEPNANAEAAAPWLRPDGGTTLLVGHEPFLSSHACWLLTARSHGFLELARSGVIVLQGWGSATAGDYVLEGLYTPEPWAITSI